MNYWLVKSDPDTYGWPEFAQEQRTMWNGVRNFQARNNMKAMKNGDLVLFYHSQTDPGVVGLAKVVREFYQDPTTEDPQWVVIDIEVVEEFPRKVKLKDIKAEPVLANIALIKQSRLSVMPISAAEFDRIVGLAHPNA
jgi:predicted RNA-binding protein with PUA-like domain